MEQQRVLKLPWQRVWITGASSGIGRALSLALCQQGLEVYASARNVQGLESLRQECQQLPGTLIPCALDITHQNAVEQQLQRWQSQQILPELSILNAGTHDPFGAEQFTSQRAARLLEINLQGSINCLAPLLELYRQNNRGQIAIMASVAGFRGLPSAAVYGASKAALIHLCESLRFDLQSTGVELQVINPGFVKTPLTDKNQFHMPALMSAEQAAETIIKGLLRPQQFEITFPKRFVVILKLLRLLPYRCYFPLVSKLLNK